jgi:hypothetical protein
MSSICHCALTLTSDERSIGLFRFDNARMGALDFKMAVPLSDVDGLLPEQLWGTSGNAICLDVPDAGNNVIQFDTLSSPPLAWLHAVGAQYHGIAFQLEYSRPDDSVQGVFRVHVAENVSEGTEWWYDPDEDVEDEQSQN